MARLVILLPAFVGNRLMRRALRVQTLRHWLIDSFYLVDTGVDTRLMPSTLLVLLDYLNKSVLTKNPLENRRVLSLRQADTTPVLAATSQWVQAYEYHAVVPSR